MPTTKFRWQPQISSQATELCGENWEVLETFWRNTRAVHKWVTTQWDPTFTVFRVTPPQQLTLRLSAPFPLCSHAISHILLLHCSHHFPPKCPFFKLVQLSMFVVVQFLTTPWKPQHPPSHIIISPVQWDTDHLPPPVPTPVSTRASVQHRYLSIPC